MNDMTGPMCGICEMGDGAQPTHYRDSTGACVPCAKMGVAWLQLAMFSLVVPIMVLLLIWIVRKCKKRAQKRPAVRGNNPTRMQRLEDYFDHFIRFFGRTLNHVALQLRQVGSSGGSKIKAVFSFYQAWVPCVMLFLKRVQPAAR